MSEGYNIGRMAQVVALDGTCRLGREDIGGKAWGINRMRALGLSVPPAIAITTQACREYHSSGGAMSEILWAQIVQHMQLLEQGTSRRFGGPQRPLLVAVRSGAAHSMPGMMDTVLNLGINTETQGSLAAETGDAAYAAETYRRFSEQYRKVVLNARADPIPADPWAQLRAAVLAVFDSWHSPRAQIYRRNRNLAEDDCTAVTIQAMVFGNLDDRSGTGVLFSRNPITGDAPAWGEWLCRSQGEEVVSGRRTPDPLSALRDSMPAVHAALMQGTARLENDACDIQDIEFTVESGHLWFLQTRAAKRSPQAALHAAVAFANEGLISKEEAVRRIKLEQVQQLPALQLAPKSVGQPPLATGEPACPGVASGMVVTDPEEAEVRARHGEAVVLARATTSPEDLHGIIAARALITEQGGATSHAAVLSRELGRPCIVGCGSQTVTRLAGKLVTLDGASGRVWAGDLTLLQSERSGADDVRTLIEWGMPLLSMQLLRPEDAPADTIDLDALGEHWRAALKPGASVRGRVLETAHGIRATMTAGVRSAVVHHRLAALVACLQPPADTQQSPASLCATGIGHSELTLLRLLALKGRASESVLADALGLMSVGDGYAALQELGLCTNATSGLRLTPAGRARLAQLLAEERARVDPAAMLVAYQDFCVINAELKQIMTAWQINNGAMPNDHADAEYDRAVLQRLANLHDRALPLLRRLTKLAPRLSIYEVRLNRAAARIAAGDAGYVAKIIRDSYHTVWFELHEDLISLIGLTRENLAREASRPGTSAT